MMKKGKTKLCVSIPLPENGKYIDDGHLFFIVFHFRVVCVYPLYVLLCCCCSLPHTFSNITTFINETDGFCQFSSSNLFFFLLYLFCEDTIVIKMYWIRNQIFQNIFMTGDFLDEKIQIIAFYVYLYCLLLQSIRKTINRILPKFVHPPICRKHKAFSLVLN